MSVFFLKSLLGIGILVSAVVAVFTMLEIFGRSEKKYDIEKLKKIHRANGILYFILFLFISYFCIEYIIKTKMEPSARALFHSLSAVVIVILLALKVSIVRVYRQFYNQVKIIGFLIALISFAMFAASGGYYLLITKFGSDKAFMEAVSLKKEPVKETVKIVLKTDPQSIGKGKESKGAIPGNFPVFTSIQVAKTTTFINKKRILPKREVKSSAIRTAKGRFFNALASKLLIKCRLISRVGFSIN